MSRMINRFEKPEMWFELKKRCMDELGIEIFATSVDRDYREQYAYWCQGRESLQTTNAARKIAGMQPISMDENQRKITWTLNSMHLVNPDDERLDNDKSRAIDFAIMYKERYVSSIKADVNEDNIPDYLQVAMIAEEIGFKSGRHFKNPDYPHLELPKKEVI